METPHPDTRAWAKARDFFLDIAGLPAEEREKQLADLESTDAQIANWVRRLVEQDLGASDPCEDPATGQIFGPYETVRLIAVGGMGEVLLARRSDGEFEREVAIKRLHGGALAKGLVERFLRERQTLARLDHEYIARLIDGGTSDAGEPYLVLEYVEGRHIDDYCREEALSVAQRVALFMEVLEAVAHAHERDVVHRDLKPSNILIRSDGSPRLLDFGIARSEAGAEGTPTLTGTGQRLFTPGFASPEQIRGERATQASDVFSLGVILYTLLAGRGPWQEGTALHTLELEILERDPLPPSRHLSGCDRRLVQGDLDTIVLRCLKKRVDRRYASVEELRQELERHCAGLSIQARPTRKLERLLRYSRRNPWQAVAAGVFVVALVATGFALRSSRAATSRSEELIETLEARVDHALSLREQDMRSESLGELTAVLESLESIEGQDDLRLRALAAMARALQELDQIEASMAYVEQGLAALPDDPSRNIDERVDLLTSSLVYHRNYSAPEVARDMAAKIYGYTQQWLEPGSTRRVRAIEARATDRGIDLDERIALMKEAIDERRILALPHDGVLGGLLTTYGFMMMEKEEFEAALGPVDEALSIDRWNHGESHGDVAIGRYCRGVCFLNLNRLDKARTELTAALATFERTQRDDMAELTRKFLQAIDAGQ